MEFQAGGGAVWVLRILFSVVVAVTAGALWIVLQLGDICPASVALLVLLLMPIGWWYVGRWCASIVVHTTEKAVQVRYGVVWCRELFVSLTSLRTFEVWVPPLHRLFGCRTVVLRFAGGAARIPLLAKEGAERLTAWLERVEEEA